MEQPLKTYKYTFQVPVRPGQSLDPGQPGRGGLSSPTASPVRGMACALFRPQPMRPSVAGGGSSCRFLPDAHLRAGTGGDRASRLRRRRARLRPVAGGARKDKKPVQEDGRQGRRQRERPRGRG